MNTLYTFTLFLHSWNRWLILVAGLIVIFTAMKGLSAKAEYSSFQKKWGLIFLSSLHLQLLVGLVMYFFLSPVTMQALSDFGAAMKSQELRFFAVEHAFVNLIAIAVAQTGSILVKKTVDPSLKNRRTLIYTCIAYVLILSMIPMGIMGIDRPLFRF